MPGRWILYGRYGAHASSLMGKAAPEGEGDRHSVETVCPTTSYLKWEYMWILTVRLLQTKAWMAVFTVQRVEEMAVAQPIQLAHLGQYQQGGSFKEGVTFRHRRKCSTSLYYSSWHAPLFWTRVWFLSWNQEETAVWTAHLHNFPSPKETELGSVKTLGKTMTERKTHFTV